MAALLTAKLAQGVVFLALGLTMLFGWKKISQLFVDQHLAIWKSVDKFSVILSKTIILTVGVAFVLGGIWLIYQHMKGRSLF